MRLLIFSQKKNQKIGDNVIDLIQFVSHELYLFVAFMCGLVLGYIVGKSEGND
jgi:hypothetical protein